MLIAKGISNSQLGRLVGRSTAPPFFGLLATAIFVLATLSWFQRSEADEAQSNQVALNQIAVLTRKLNNLKLTALKEQDLTDATATERRAARRALRDAALMGHLRSYHIAAVQEVWPAFDSYLTSVDRQWTLVLVGNFD